MKYYDSMGFESEHGIWVRRVDAVYAIDEAQMAAVTLSSKLGTAETRIEELESAIRDCCSDAGCFGNFDEACCISDEPVDTWCAPCKLSTYLCSPSSCDNLSSGTAKSDATVGRGGEHGGG